MDKQKYEEEKMRLVGQLNAMDEIIDSYSIPEIDMDNGEFKELSNRKYGIELRIKELNFLIDNCK